MDGPRELVKGEVYGGIPVDGWNYFKQTCDRVNRQPQITSPAVSAAGAPAVPVEVVNLSGDDFDARFPVVWLKKPLLTPDDNDQIEGDGVIWEAAVPDENTAIDEIAILDAPCGDGMAGGGTVLGRCWVDVDILSEDDRFAVPISGDAAKLQSGSSGARIRWKPEGTGVKRCLVVLGGGGSGGGSLPILAVAIVAEAGAAAGDNFKVENPWLYEPSGEEGEEEGTWLPGEWTPNPDWVITCGSVDHLKILEEPEVEGDEPTTPVLIVVSDMFLDFPIIGNKVRIESVIDYATDFICTRKTC